MLLDPTGTRRLKIAIATPCTDTVDAGYAYDLTRLVGRMAKDRPDLELTVHQNRGTILPQQRHTLVLSAREAHATHVLWIDSDMRFPADALTRLLAHDQPIVAVNYPTRRLPILPTAEHRQHGYLFTPPDADGLADVTHCGMGMMLVDLAVYAAIPLPWFAIGFNPKDGEYGGEDFFFCTRAREAGFSVRIDQGLSREIGHAGQMVFRPDHALVTRDVAAERERLAESAATATAAETDLLGAAHGA